MKESKKVMNSGTVDLGLADRFGTLNAELTEVIDALDGIKPLKSARKELKAFRLAISAIERQVALYEKNPLG